MAKAEKERVTLGYVPLVDCAPLIVAEAKGLFATAGVDVALSQEASWANIRDKVCVGELDGGQMLGPMPIASTLGLGGLKTAVITALGLSLGGNAITFSQTLVHGLPTAASAIDTARAVGDRLRRRHRAAPLTLAVPFPFSSHTYLLRHWLLVAGLAVGPDVRIVTVPPSRMVVQLAAGTIDGYCVGEPWNAQAVQDGVGTIVASSRTLWNNHPEKVFGVTADWASSYPATHQALIRTLIEACRWADAPEHRDELYDLLVEPLGVARHVVAASFTGPSAGAPVFFRAAATFPWRSQAMWWTAEMQRWGQLSALVDLADVARLTYRPDLYRSAAAALGIAVPEADTKCEGGHADVWPLRAHGPRHAFPSSELMIAMEPDVMLGAAVLDPADPSAYLASALAAAASHATTT